MVTRGELNEQTIPFQRLTNQNDDLGHYEYMSNNDISLFDMYSIIFKHFIYVSFKILNIHHDHIFL